MDVPQWFLDQKIPYDVWYYRNYMNGVDIHDRRVKHIDMYMQCFRWPTRIFQFYELKGRLLNRFFYKFESDLLPKFQL